MEKPWFQNKQCLDIGCNEGMITLALASHFGTASMLGVDIDRKLIGRGSRFAAAHVPSTAPSDEASRLLLPIKKYFCPLCLPVRGSSPTSKEEHCRVCYGARTQIYHILWWPYILLAYAATWRSSAQRRLQSWPGHHMPGRATLWRARAAARSTGSHRPTRGAGRLLQLCRACGGPSSSMAASWSW